MTNVQRNRSLPADMHWMLEIAGELEGGRIELEQIDTAGRYRVRATLMADNANRALVGIGKNATEAVSELRRQIEDAYEAQGGTA